MASTSFSNIITIICIKSISNVNGITKSLSKAYRFWRISDIFEDLDCSTKYQNIISGNRNNITWGISTVAKTKMYITCNIKRNWILKILTFDAISNKRLGKKYPSILGRTMKPTGLEKRIFLKYCFKTFLNKFILLWLAFWSMNTEYFLIRKRLVITLA